MEEPQVQLGTCRNSLIILEAESLMPHAKESNQRREIKLAVTTAQECRDPRPCADVPPRMEICDSIALPSIEGQGETLEELNRPCPWMAESPRSSSEPDCNDVTDRMQTRSGPQAHMMMVNSSKVVLVHLNQLVSVNSGDGWKLVALADGTRHPHALNATASRSG